MQEYKDKIIKLIESNEFNNKIFSEFICEEKLNTYKNICIYGSEITGHRIYKLISKYFNKNIVFCDSNTNKWGKSIINNIRCISLEELRKVKDETFVIIASEHISEIEETLKSNGVKMYCDYLTISLLEYLRGVPVLTHNSEEIWRVKNKIRKVCDILEDEYSLKVFYVCLKNYIKYKSVFDKKNVNVANELYTYKAINEDNQYFYSELVEFDSSSNIVDCGAYIGDTIMEIVYRDIPFDKYFAFEMDKENYGKLMNNLNKTSLRIREKIKAFNLGVYSETKEVIYSNCGQENKAGSSMFLQGQRLRARVTALDEKLDKEAITHIKMDIEGAEVFALKGAEQIIKSRRPTLMICLYHRINDFWNIPIYINDTVSGYKFYMRHHSDSVAETVLYAVPSENSR